MYVQIWLAILLIFLVAEIVTTALVSLWFVGGAAAALAAAALGAPLWLQFTLFVLVSAALLLLLRPLTKKYFAPKAKFGTDRMLGERAPVTERIDNLAATGTVRLDGKEWSARSTDGSIIEAGSVVTVRGVEGVKVLVEPQKEEGVSL